MNFYKDLRIKARDALQRAIKEFISQDEIIPDSYLEEMAMEYVMDHDKDIRDGLRDMIDLEGIFDDELDQAIEDAYESY